MKKIALVVSWNGKKDSGGVERVTQYLVNSLENDYFVELIDYDLVCQHKILRHLVKHNFIFDSLIFSIFVSKRKRDLTYKDRANNVITVTQGYNAPFVKADYVYAHGTMRGYKEATSLKKIKWQPHQYFEKRAWQKAKKIISVSNQVAYEAIHFYNVSPEKITIIENCVDTLEFSPIPRQNDILEKTCRILFCGRLEKEKGLKELKELAKTIEFMDDFILLIATPNNANTEYFRQFSKTEIKVGLTKNELNKFYNSGDIMFFPSEYEGFGLVCIECLSAGTPVMGYEIGVFVDLMKLQIDATAIITSDMGLNLLKLKELSSKYKKFDARENLHDIIDKHYSYSIYKTKVNKLFEHNQ